MVAIRRHLVPECTAGHPVVVMEFL
jgi:hypothetical protein